MGLFTKTVGNFDYATVEDMKNAETYVTAELISRGFYPVVIYNGDDMCEVEIRDSSDASVLTVKGVDYVDAIVNIGAHLFGVN